VPSPRVLALVLFVAVPWVLEAPAAADRVTPKKGASVRGFVSQSDTEVVVNRYRAKNPAMTYGVVRFALADVKRIDEDPPTAETIRRRREDLAPTDVAGRVGLARYAVSQKFVREANRCLEEALALDPTDADALALYGGAAKFEAARRGKPALVPALRAALATYLGLADGKARAAAAPRLEAEFGFPARAEVLERAWRSARVARGLTEDAPVTFRADRHPGATWTYYVPPGYDPFVPTPLLVALHDAGRGGREGTTVVGSGRDAATLYLEAATTRGWLLACPTAPTPAWSGDGVGAHVGDVLDEACARFHVDLDRVYLVGHGTGGTVALTVGGARPDVFAAIGATAPTAPVAPTAAARAGTAVFLYHADDDPTTDVGVTRAVADALLKASADVVYLELTGVGHGFPSDALRELADVFRGKRLADGKRPDDHPRSSFARPAGPAEVAAVGDPAAGWAPPK
jgi:pimeloyl-ACP methyl ester carboxylesterase